MRKMFSFLAIAAFVAACAIPAPVAAAAEPVDIEFWTFQDLHVKFYEKMAQQWNESHPDEPINLIASEFPYDNMHNKLLIAFQAGVGAPDMVDIEIAKYANFLRGDIQLVPLNDIIEPELDNIVKARVEIYSKDGQYYGICFHVGATVIYYNVELCEKAGIDWKNIKTYDDYYEAGKKLKAAFPDKYWATVETADPWHLWPMLSSQGGDMLDADGKPNINSPQMVKALEFNRKLVREGIATIAPGGFHHTEEFYAYMNSGEVASLIMPMWYMERFVQLMPDLSGKIAIAPMPVWVVGQPRSVGMGGTGTSVTKAAKNPDLVKRFLAFAKLSKEGNIEVWNSLGFDTIRTEVWSMPDVVNAKNKFTTYFVNNPFDVLNQIKDEILPIHVSEALPAVLDAIKNSILYRAYIEDGDIAEMLAEEQANIQY